MTRCTPEQRLGVAIWIIASTACHSSLKPAAPLTPKLLGEACTATAQCDAELQCFRAACTLTCESHSACDAGQRCIGGVCLEARTSCLDGVVDEGEACDDGNEIDNDACRNDCELPVCGDAVVRADILDVNATGYESCDDGDTLDSGNGCSATCTITAVCGDNVVQSLVEQCDDGNQVSFDGCSATCSLVAWRIDLGTTLSSQALAAWRYGDPERAVLGVATAAGELVVLDRETGAIVWRHDTGVPLVGPPVVGSSLRLAVLGIDGVVRGVRTDGLAPPSWEVTLDGVGSALAVAGATPRWIVADSQGVLQSITDDGVLLDLTTFSNVAIPLAQRSVDGTCSDCAPTLPSAGIISPPSIVMSTGDAVWMFDLWDQDGPCDPYVLDMNAGEQVVGGVSCRGDDDAQMYDPEDKAYVATSYGRILQGSFTHPAACTGAIQVDWVWQTSGTPIAAPLIAELDDGRRIVVATAEGTIVALRTTADAPTPTTPLWTYDTGEALATSPTLDGEGTVYVASTSGRLHVIGPDGVLRRQFELGAGPAGGPMVVDGTIYAATTTGVVYAIEAGTTDAPRAWWSRASGNNSNSSTSSNCNQLGGGHALGFLALVMWLTLRRRGARGAMLGIVMFLVATSVQAQSPAEEVLVIVNDNSIASQDIAADYVAERGVPAEHVCHVRAPNSRAISYAAYRTLRDFIITDCICPLIDIAEQPSACLAPTPEAIQTAITQFIPATPIRFLLTTDGLPFFFTFPTDCSGTSASIDNNLAYDLVSAMGVLRGDGADCLNGPRSSYYFPDGPPPLDPAMHAMILPGRLEADTPTLAKQLVRRAMQAEQDGFTGRWHFNRSWSSYIDSETAFYSAHAAFLDGDACLPSAVTNYNLTTCDATFTQSQIPSSKIPIVDAASVYLGSYQNTGFGNWDNFMHWRIDTTCNPGTVNAPNYAWDPVTGEARAGGCVGVLPGFVGNQFGSFTCDKSRLAPTFWKGETASSAQIPSVVDAIGHSGSHSLLFGTDDEVAAPLPGPAPQRYVVTADGLVPSTITVFTEGTVNLWVRTQALAASGGGTARMSVNVISYLSDGTSTYRACSPSLALPGETAGGWTELTCTINNAAETRTLTRLALQLGVSNFTGKLYLDDVKLTLPGGEELLGSRNPSFEEGERDAASYGNSGNWCVGWDSLLGATAVFGSVSHWMTNGWSHRQTSTLAGLLSSRLLGELVWGSQSTVGSAVLIGDPIYEPPFAVEVRVDAPQGRIDPTTPTTVSLYGSARNGRRTDRWNAVTYELSFAAGTDPLTATGWQTTGISTTADGVGARNDEVLGTWDTSTITSGDYVVRIVAMVPWEDGSMNDVVGYGRVTIDRPCLPTPCTEPHRGQCAEIDEDLVMCSCDPGFAEDDSGTCVDDICDPDPCGDANGHCERTIPTPTCACNDGYTAVDGLCVLDVCTPNPCTAPLRSVCAIDGGTASCGCDAGYVEDAAGRCIVDLCAQNPCTAPHQTHCVNDNGSAICLCDTGYYYDGGETCVPMPADPQPARDNGCGCTSTRHDVIWMAALFLALLRRRRPT